MNNGTDGFESWSMTDSCVDWEQMRSESCQPCRSGSRSRTVRAEEVIATVVEMRWSSWNGPHQACRYTLTCSAEASGSCLQSAYPM
jgi:hypothetical protein